MADKFADMGDIDFYVVFDPADESGLVYRWYGGQTINIIDSESLTEIDVYNIGDIEDPNLEQVQDSVSEHHYTVLQEMARGGELGNDQDSPDDAQIDMASFENRVQ